MKNILLLLSLAFLFSCSDNIEYNLSSDYREKSFETIKYAGSYCSESCVWSKYAVDLNIQEKSADCVEGPCVCVKEGDVHTLCSASAEPENIWAQDSTTQQSVETSTNNVPYYNQYDNINYPYATCQNTSIAMVLSSFQENIHPDDIFSRWGKDMAQSPSGLNYIYRHYATNSVISTYTNASPEDLKNALSQGYLAIVHGYFTSSGHVLVVKSFDGQSYYVNDPAGRWSECFKCGYSTGDYNGVTKYSKQSFENAVFTSNGSAYLPGWIHLIKGY